FNACKNARYYLHRLDTISPCHQLRPRTPRSIAHTMTDERRPSPGTKPDAESAARRRALATVEQVFRRCAISRGLFPSEIRSLVEAVRPVSFRAGQVICRQHEPGNSMYIVGLGRVRVSVEEANREFRLLDHLGRGEQFG